jgi:hypothetical protein
MLGAAMTERMAGRVPVPDRDRPWVACIRRPAAGGAGVMDEFGLLQENAAEHGLPFPGRPPVRRQMVRRLL